MEAKLLSLIKSVSQGSMSIQDAWFQYSGYIESLNPHLLNSPQECIALGALYFRYSQYLYSDGYIDKAITMVSKAINVHHNATVTLPSGNYSSNLTTLLEFRSNLYYAREDYVSCFKDMRELRQLHPYKDEYLVNIKGCFKALLHKICVPIYISVGILWLLMLADLYLLHFGIFSGVLWHIAWTIWLLAILSQYTLPWILFKLGKL